MRLAFHPEARLEVLEARAWYEERSPGLGYEFARAVDTAISSVLRMPNSFPRIEDGCRRALLRKFPFSIIFRVSELEIRVYAVYHHRRQPRAWLGRLGG